MAAGLVCALGGACTPIVADARQTRIERRVERVSMSALTGEDAPSGVVQASRVVIETENGSVERNGASVVVTKSGDLRVIAIDGDLTLPARAVRRIELSSEQQAPLVEARAHGPQYTPLILTGATILAVIIAALASD
ncbi:MAG: hypothetical protein U1F43_30325 [Myxococcota bacterium]